MKKWMKGELPANMALVDGDVVHMIGAEEKLHEEE